MKYRLSRLDQIYAEHLFYFITICTHERRKLLANEEMHRQFQAFCRQVTDRHVLVGRYVIMPDHIHFFVALDERVELSGWMKSLKNYLSKTFRAQGITAPHWQKGFFDHLMRSEESYGSKWEYVNENPMRHGLVTEAFDWVYQGEIHPLSFS